MFMKIKVKQKKVKCCSCGKLIQPIKEHQVGSVITTWVCKDCQSQRKLFCSTCMKEVIPKVIKIEWRTLHLAGGNASLFRYNLICPSCDGELYPEDDKKFGMHDMFCPECGKWVNTEIHSFQYSYEILCPECGYVFDED